MKKNIIKNTFLDSIFSEIELFLKNPAKKMKTEGRPKKYSDTLIFKLGILRVFLGIDTENKFLRMIRDSKEYEYLGEIPSNSVFNHRFRKLCSDGVTMTFFETLLENNPDMLKGDVRIVDSEPIIFKNFKRKIVKMIDYSEWM